MGTYQTYLTVFHFKAATLPQPTTWWTTRWWRPRMLMRLCSTRSQSQRQVLGRSCMKYISTQHIKRPVCGSVYTTSPLMSKLSTSILSFDVSYQTSTKMDSAVLGKLVASRPTITQLQGSPVFLYILVFLVKQCQHLTAPRRTISWYGWALWGVVSAFGFRQRWQSNRSRLSPRSCAPTYPRCIMPTWRVSFIVAIILQFHLCIRVALFFFLLLFPWPFCPARFSSGVRHGMIRRGWLGGKTAGGHICRRPW